MKFGDKDNYRKNIKLMKIEFMTLKSLLGVKWLRITIVSFCLTLFMLFLSCASTSTVVGLVGKYENSETGEFCEFHKNGILEYKIKPGKDADFFTGCAYFNSNLEIWIPMSRDFSHDGILKLSKTDNPNVIKNARIWDETEIELGRMQKK